MSLPPSLVLSLDRVLLRHDELRDMLSSGTLSSDALTKASKEYADQIALVESANALRAAETSMNELEAMSAAETDPDMRKMAEAEFYELKEQIPLLVKNVQRMLLPKDAADERNAILEIRAGAGGDEAALFAAQMFEVYQRYATKQGWRFEVMEISDTGIGGYKEASAEISGQGVFARLKFESGVHRVQRVPKTESAGRIHTSTITVAVLPEAEEVDVKIEDKDLKIETMRLKRGRGPACEYN